MTILLRSLPSRRRKQLVFLLGLMMLAAVAEVVSLGAILPFLAVLAQPQNALQKPIVQLVLEVLELNSSEDIRWAMTMLFGSVAIVAGIIRFLLIYATVRINYGIGHELVNKLYRRVLYQSYEVHISRNASEIQAGIEKVDIIVHLLHGVLNLISSTLISAFIIGGMFLFDPMVASTVLLCLGIMYSISALLTAKLLSANSAVIQRTMGNRIQTMNEGLGGIRDVLLDHSQEQFSQRFNRIDWAFRKAQGSNYILGTCPRSIVETFGIVLVACAAYALTMREPDGNGLINAIPVMGMLALGTQRVIPLLQQVYQGWSSLLGSKSTLEDVAKLISVHADVYDMQNIQPLPFSKCINFHNVYFSYGAKTPNVLKNVNFRIDRGQRIGLIGETGSGKSTAIDLLMGLLQPTHGKITVDGVPLVGQARLSWQAHIGHVSQFIFLADCSLAENIAFGLDKIKINHQQVHEAAHKAQISDFIEALPNKYETQVGERGVKLSGGQRQRIGIARALYKNADVLVLDEATSALDNATEQSVMDEIDCLGKDTTVIIIAHRISTLSSCDYIFEFDNGRLLRICNYSDIIDAKSTPKYTIQTSQIDAVL